VKFLYLPNEGRLGDQYGPRRVLKTLADEDVLSSLEIFSFLLEAKKEGSDKNAHEKLMTLVEDSQPDVVFWQHPDRFEIPQSFPQQIKKIRSKPTLVYHEADPWGGRKSITSSMKTLASCCDMLILSGEGSFFRIFRKAGARNMIYAPNCVDESRFGDDWKPTRERQFDVVMIANPLRPKVPFLELTGWPFIPGVKERILSSRFLGESFGDRFALYGNGWEGFKGQRGSLPFDQQQQKIREGWVSFCWDHFDNTPKYFSNRLPISMACGVAHVTNYKPGFESLFENWKHLVWVDRPEETVQVIRDLLDRGPEFLVDMGRRGREIALGTFSAEKVYRGIVEQIVVFRRNLSYS